MQRKQRLAVQIAEHAEEAECLRQQCRHSCAVKAHKMNEERIEPSIQERADEHGDHLEHAVAVAAHDSGEVAVEIHWQIAENVDRQIAVCQRKDFRWCLQQQQERCQCKFQDQRQSERKYHCHDQGRGDQARAAKAIASAHRL